MEIGSLDLIARVAVAAALGALIGVEREARDQPAGLRTHALVALGAALFTMAGAYGFQDVHEDGVTWDPTRVAAQVAAGIGFIGAGAILRIGVTVRGLTTAGTLWLAAALGVAAGAGAYLLAIAGCVASLIIVAGLRFVPIPYSDARVVTLEYRPGHGTMGALIAELERSGIEPGKMQVSDTDQDDARDIRRVAVNVRVRDTGELDRILRVLRDRPEVLMARWDDGR